MRTETATEAKNNFGAILDAALREPVLIQRSGRNAAVLMAYEEYEELMRLVDAHWGKKAVGAKRTGMVGAKKSKQLIESLLSARD